MLATPHGATIDEIVEAFECSRHTALRSIASLEENHDRIEREPEGRKLRFRIHGTRAQAGATPRIDAMSVVGVVVAEQLLNFLEGSLFKEAFAQVVSLLETKLAPKEFACIGELRKRIVVVDRAPWKKDDRADLIDELVTAMLRNERVSMTGIDSSGKERVFDFDPYNLVIYHQGIYTHGPSHFHNSARTFGLDKLTAAERKRDETFEVVSGWDGHLRFRGSFSIFDHPETKVRVEFTAAVRRFVERCEWAPDQVIEELENGGIIITLTARGTIEVKNWVLSYGADAKVLEPESLRREVAAITKKMAAIYEEPSE